MTSLENQKTENKMINTTVSLQDYIKMRKERDSKLKAPRYIHPSIQVILYIHLYMKKKVLICLHVYTD